MKPKNSAEWRGGIVLAILVILLIFLSLWNRGRVVPVAPVEVSAEAVETPSGNSSGSVSVRVKTGKRRTSSRRGGKGKRGSGKQRGSNGQPPRSFLDEEIPDSE